MPIHLHPYFRALEQVEESAGLIQKIDSLAVTLQKALEAAGSTYQDVVTVTSGTADVNFINFNGVNASFNLNY